MRLTLKTAHSWLTLSVVLMVLISSGTILAAEQPKYGGEFNYAWERDIGTFDPASANSPQKSNVAVIMFEQLLNFDSDGSLIPGLAHSWDISEDGLVYTFYLREGVKFHTGRLMTAHDVKYSYERLSNPKTAALGFDELASVRGKREFAEGKADEIVGIRVIDDFTLEIELEQPDAVFLRRLATAYTSIVGYEGINEDLEMVIPIGTGPFKYVEYVPNQHIKMVRNPDYWQEGKPYLDRVNVYMNVDPAVQLMKYQIGELDILEIYDPEVKVALENDPRSKNDLIQGPGPSIQVLTLNTQHGPFVNKDLRLALNYAIDRERIAKNVIKGLGTPAYNPQPQAIAEYLELPNYYGYDPEKAKELMAKAGYPDGFTIELVCVPTSVQRIAAEGVQADLAKIGINVELRVVESAAYTALMNSSEVPFGMVNCGSAMGDPDWVFSRFLHSGRIPGMNRAAYSNPQFDELVDRARQTVDEEERKALYRQATEIMMEDAPWVTLYYQHSTRAVKPYVRGLKLMPTRPEISITDVWLDK